MRWWPPPGTSRAWSPIRATRERLRELLQGELQNQLQDTTFELSDSIWLEAVSNVLSVYDLLKILRDEIVWIALTNNGDPSITYHVYRTLTGAPAARASGPSR